MFPASDRARNLRRPRFGVAGAALLVAACASPLPPSPTAASLRAGAPPIPPAQPKLTIESPLLADHGRPPRITQVNASASAPRSSVQGGSEASPPEGALAQEGPASAPASRPGRARPPLELAEVLDSVRQRFPPMLAALLEEDIASGRLLAAQGGFDFNIVAKSTLSALGFYQYSDSAVALEQPTTLGGLALLGGYKISTGDVPPYYGEKKTNYGGEISAGFRLPLLQGNAIDRRRATLSQAEIDKALADPTIFRQRLDFVRIAARAYWNWVAAGRRLEIAEDLLRIALERDRAIARRVELGDIPGIDRIDNERLVVQRRSFVVAAERRFVQAAIELSLYYRDEKHEPIVAKRDRLPDAFPPLPELVESTFEMDVASALGARPELQRLRLLGDKLGIDLRVADNDLLPTLDLRVLGSVPFRDEPYVTDAESDVTALLDFKFPVQRREAKGRGEAARAQILRVAFETQFARDRIRAEIADALSAKVAAHRQIAEFARNAELARRVEQAERKAFDLGRSNLIFVNLREQATADAEALEVDAVAEYFRTTIDYAVACGQDDSMVP